MKITKAMVVDQILKNFQKDGVHVKKGGKSFVPQTVEDLQPRIIKRTINKKNNKHYDKAPRRQRLRRRISGKLQCPTITF